MFIWQLLSGGGWKRRGEELAPSNMLGYEKVTTYIKCAFSVLSQNCMHLKIAFLLFL